jgi:carbon starvation protein
VCTSIVIKMGKKRFVWVTLLPLGWLVSITMTASGQKVWSPNPRIGFLAHARQLVEKLGAGHVPASQVLATERLIFNDRLDAVVTLLFASLVLLIVAESGRHWWLYAFGGKKPVLREAPMEPSRLTA